MRLILTYVGYKSVVSVVIIGKNLFVDEKRDDILFVPLSFPFAKGQWNKTLLFH